MNIFSIYLEKIREFLINLEKDKQIKLFDNLNNLTIELTPKDLQGDISCNAALVLSKTNNKKPQDIAALLKANLIKKFRKELVISQIIRESINCMVTDIIENTKKNINKYKIKSLNNIYSCNKPIICFSNQMKEADSQIKFFLNNKMYNNKYVLKKTNEGKKIIKNLFNKLNKNPKKYIRNDLLKTGIKERVIADFIAGMTDRFAINLNRNFK